jgi:LPS O-antigen subunit length determinant protein (WzzB/FepE family)
MKKVLGLIVIAGMAALIACGPSAADKAAAEQRVQDSLRTVAIQDSIAAAELAAKEAAELEAQRIADSIAAAEAAKPKPKGTGTAPKPKDPEPKPTRPGATKS